MSAPTSSPYRQDAATAIDGFPPHAYPMRLEVYRRGDAPGAPPLWQAVADGPCALFVPHLPVPTRARLVLATGQVIEAD